MSNFSVHGKANFSEIQTSEVSMGNPNTAEEKKSKIETKKQEIKENQEINGENINNIEQNPEEIGTGIEIGEFEKNGLATSNQIVKNQGKVELANIFPLELSISGILSQSSGLDDGSESLGILKSTTTTSSNKPGSGSVNQATGIPKFNSQINGKKVDGAKEIPRKISPSTRQSMGKIAPEVTEMIQDDSNTGKKKSNPPINPRNPATGKYTSRLSLTNEQQTKWNDSLAKGERNPNLGPVGMKSIEIDNAAQRLVERIRLSSSLVVPDEKSSSLELQTPPTKAKSTQGLNPGSKALLDEGIIGCPSLRY